MAQINGVGFLSSLGVVSVLLIGFLSANPGYGVTDPQWIGLLSNVLYSVGWYSLFFSIVITVFTLTFNFMWDTPLRVRLPAFATLLGLVLYIFEQIVYFHYLYMGMPMYDYTFDTTGNPMDNLAKQYPGYSKWSYYLAQAVPLWLMTIAIFAVVAYDCIAHLMLEKSPVLRKTQTLSRRNIANNTRRTSRSMA